MSEEGRRIFKMDTVLSLFAGKEGGDVTDLLGFLAQRELAAGDEKVVAALGKAWLAKQHPDFLDCKYDESAVYGDWVAKEKKRLGDNVSIPAVPADELADIAAVLDELAAARVKTAEQAEAISGLEAQVAELEPYQGKTADLEKKVEGLEAKVAELEEAKAELAGKVAEFDGKVAIDESAINATVESIVSQAVKNAVASMPAGGAAAAEGGEAAPAEEAAADQGGGVPDTFGFGSSGDDSDGFGF